MTRRHGPWTIKETTEIYKNDFIEVTEDKVIKPDGKPGHYATVTAMPGVAVLPLDKEGFVYLTKQFRYALGDESIEAVAGGVDEEKPEEAARRELREELGIEADEWTSLGLVNLDTSIINSPARIFLATGLRFTEPEREGTETIKTVKVKLEEAVRMVMESEITHAVSCALILKTRLFLES
jgi:8-oxo-dGTP pyrophosphatase MutT (NUDIX family)